MHHAILGPGGVGGLVAASLARSGEAVTVVLRSDASRQFPETLELDSPFGKVSARVAHSTTVPPADVLWIAVKATQLEASLTALRNGNFVGAIVPLLNGVDHVEMLRSRYGVDRIVPATIAVESERVASGRIVHRSPFARLSVSSTGQPLLQSALQKLEAFGFTCRFVDDEQTLLWGKLVFLAPLALTTTAANMTIGEISADAAWRERLESCVREACVVARAEGASVDEESVISAIRKLPGNMQTSMQKDVERGSIPELDAIAGPILRYAHRHHLAVPATLKLVGEVEHRMTAKRI